MLRCTINLNPFSFHTPSQFRPSPLKPVGQRQLYPPMKFLQTKVHSWLFFLHSLISIEMTKQSYVDVLPFLRPTE